MGTSSSAQKDAERRWLERAITGDMGVLDRELEAGSTPLSSEGV
jgi:hypothetical protein